jgi:hypothetical protein
MSICIHKWKFPRILPRSELRERNFFSMGTGMERKSPPWGLRGGMGKKHLSLRIRPFLNFFIFIFENSRYLFCDILVLSFVWLCIFCYKLWNVLVMRFCMIISNQMFLHYFLVMNALYVVFYFLKRTWKYLVFLLKRKKIMSYYCHNFERKI